MAVLVDKHKEGRTIEQNYAQKWAKVSAPNLLHLPKAPPVHGVEPGVSV